MCDILQCYKWVSSPRRDSTQNINDHNTWAIASVFLYIKLWLKKKKCNRTKTLLLIRKPIQRKWNYLIIEKNLCKAQSCGMYKQRLSKAV